MSNRRGSKIMDKKGCENCKTKFMCANKFGDKYCHWLRNPRRWLSILPTEPGIYFYRKCTCSKWEAACLIINESGQLLWESNRKSVKGTYEWQGPIRPEGE